MKKSKHNFSIYRGKELLDTNVEQVQAHKLAKADAIAQWRQGKLPTYILKGTFYDGQPETKIGTYNKKQNRIYWKFAKPESLG
jgi:hypothetical protein